MFNVKYQFLLNLRENSQRSCTGNFVVSTSVHFDEGFRVDLFIEGKVIIELKSVEKISNAHKKQLLTYLKLTNTKLGLILNFGAAIMIEGIERIANDL